MRYAGFVIEGRSVSDGDNTVHAIDRESATSVIGQCVADGIRSISIGGQSRDSHDGSVAGVFCNDLAGGIDIRDSGNSIVADVRHVNRHNGRACSTG